MVEIDWSSVGILVKALRNQRKIPYRELALRAGLNPGTLVRIEAGKPTRPSTIGKLEQALNLSPGLLTRSAPLMAGPFFLQEPSHELIIIRPNPNYEKTIPNYSQKSLRDPLERRRIGKLGIVSAFQWEPDLGLQGALMRATLIEIYSETLTSNHEGEELVFGVRGTSVIKIAGEELVIHENQTASFWPKEKHSYAPGNPMGGSPSLLLSVRIDSAKSVLGAPQTSIGPR
jgi:transcriptional regulator with XRE-family HTH domain